jgi:hypothetical protein
MNFDELVKNFSGDTALNVGIDTAIKALRPGAKWDLSTDGGKFKFTRFDDPENRPVPTDEEIHKEYDFQMECAKYYQYSYDRLNNYPNGFDQMDMLWHAINDGIDLKNSEWFNKIKEVKEKFPKPSEKPPTRD